jgi:hypothetical protein
MCRQRYVIAGGCRFLCKKISTAVCGNNCLGYALRIALLVSPSQLRRDLVEHLRTDPDNLMLSMSIVEDSDGMTERQLLAKAIQELSGDCMIPADVFLHFVNSNQRSVIRANYVFFAQVGDNYVPVMSHWENKRRYPTFYVGCNSENTHYSKLVIQDTVSLNEHIV